MDICLGDNLRFDNECHKICYSIFSNINDVLLIDFTPLRIDKIMDNTIYFRLEEEHLSKLLGLFEIIDEKIRICIKEKRIDTNKFAYVPVKSLLLRESRYLKLNFRPGKTCFRDKDIIDCVFWIRKLIIEEKDKLVVPDIILY